MTAIVHGFVGLGDMGAPMALRLLEGGLPLVVFDIDDQARAGLARQGATAVASVEELSERCDVIFTCLPSPAICLAVAGQIARAPGRRCTVQVEMSTVGVHAIDEIGAELAGHGVLLVDSPVSGGPRAVPRGRLTCLVSGPSAAVERLRPAYDVLAGQFFYLGEAVGLAQAMKVGNNLLASCNLAATSEVVRMLETAGIAPETAIAVINVSTGRNRASEELFPGQVLTGSFAQGARLDILAKDTDLAVGAAEHYGADFPLGRAIRDVWLSAARAGFGADDITAIYNYMGRRGRD